MMKKTNEEQDKNPEIFKSIGGFAFGWLIWRVGRIGIAAVLKIVGRLNRAFCGFESHTLFQIKKENNKMGSRYLVTGVQLSMIMFSVKKAASTSIKLTIAEEIQKIASDTITEILDKQYIEYSNNSIKDDVKEMNERNKWY